MTKQRSEEQEDIDEPSEPLTVYRNALAALEGVEGPIIEATQRGPYTAAVTPESGGFLYSQFRLPAETESTIDFQLPFSRAQSLWGETHRDRFERLKSEWKDDTAHIASPVKRAMHPAYQQIIGMGLDVVPLILNDLRNGADHWFWALKSITGKDPVSEDEKGNLEEMAESWIEWGKKFGLLGGERKGFTKSHEFQPIRARISESR